MQKEFSKKITIGITGADWYNKGAEAMMRTTIVEIKKRYPRAYFVIFVPTVALQELNPFRESFISVEVLDMRKSIFFFDLFFAFLFKLTKIELLSKVSKNLTIYKFCDIVIDIHGYALHNKNTFASVMFLLGKLLIIKMLGSKYLVFPQDFDYINNKYQRLLIRKILPFADIICVRGEQSKENLKLMLPPSVGIKIVPDIAFLLEPKMPDDADFQNWLKQKETKVIAISVNKKITRKIANPSYVEVLRVIIRELVEKKNYRVVLLPHDVRGSEKTHDLRICNEIIKELSKNTIDEIYVVDSLSYPPGVYKWIVGKCDVALTSRFHMTVASLSQKIPTITLGWSFKYMQLLRWFNSEERAFDGASVMPNDVVSEIEDLIDKQVLVTDNLKNCEKDVKKRIDIFFDDVVREQFTI